LILRCLVIYLTMRQRTPLGRVVLEKLEKLRFPKLFKEFTVLWNLNFLYLVRKELPLAHFLCQMNPVHTLASSFMLEFNFLSHLRLGFQAIFLILSFHTKTLYFCSIRTTYPAHLILLDLSTLIICGNYYKFIMQFLSVRRL
jgi:hypothetical protein